MKKLLLLLTTTSILALSSLCISSCNEVTENKPIAEHVVFIGLDGWGSYCIDSVSIPNIEKLAKDGAYTLKKRSVLPSSSAANWASMFMGAGPELHGYCTWGSKVPDLVPRELNHNNFFPNIFTILRDARPDAEIGHIYEWGGMHYLADTLSLNLDKHIINRRNGNIEMLKASTDYIKNKKPTLACIIFDEPDGVGHRIGHGTREYFEMVEHLDNCVGEIIQATKDAGTYDNTIFIITSDHGGINRGHGGRTMEEMESPFIISGKGIKKGFIIEDSMMQFDIAPTICRIFGLDCPQVWIGRSVDSAFE